MSASDDSGPFGDGSPTSVLNGTITYLDGGSLGTLLQASIFGVIVSVATGGVNLIQSVFGLVVAPLDAMAGIVESFFTSTIIEPLDVIEAGAVASGTGIADQFGPFALPVAAAVVLGTFWIFIQFLEEESTPDFIAIPGFPDIPAIGPLDVGVTEENEEEQ